MRQVRRPRGVRARLRRAARPRRRARGARRRARARRDQPHGRDGQGRVLPARVRRRLLPQVAVRRRLVPRRPSRTAAATTSPSSSARSPSSSARATCTPDVVLIQVSPPDKHGFCSFGISVDYTKPAAQVAKTVIAQVNPKMPRTHGDAFIHVSEIDLVVESDQDIIELQPPQDRPRRGGHRQAHRRPRRGRLLPAARHRRHPRRRAAVPAPEERPRHPQRDVQRGRRRPLQRGRHHQQRQDVLPRQDGRHVPHGHAAPLRLRRRQPGSSTCCR